MTTEGFLNFNVEEILTQTFIFLWHLITYYYDIWLQLRESSDEQMKLLNTQLQTLTEEKLQLVNVLSSKSQMTDLLKQQVCFYTYSNKVSAIYSLFVQIITKLLIKWPLLPLLRLFYQHKISCHEFSVVKAKLNPKTAKLDW